MIFDFKKKIWILTLNKRRLKKKIIEKKNLLIFKIGSNTFQLQFNNKI